jgi:RNA polymerase sigma-70 factor (ECF subfamily)
MVAEADLMGRYVDGDANAFRELHARIAPRLVGYLQRMTGDRALAEDLVQQSFLKVHRSRGAYVRGADPVPWIFAIARRTFLDEARRKKRSKVQVARDERAVPEPPAGLDGAAADDAASAREPGSAGDGRPEPAMVQAAIAALERLPPAQREALVLTKMGGKSIAEAAAITGTTPGAIKLRIHRGYVALRKALAAMGGTP